MASFFSKISFALFVIWLCILSPLFRIFPGLIRRFVFQPKLLVPQDADYQHPVKYGFIGGKNFYTTTADGAKLGFWHLLPENLEGKTESLNLDGMNEEDLTNVYKNILADATVFLYVHGSTSTRVLNSRITTYKMLSKLNHHVFTFDFRGYGDSTSKPRTESDLITDTLTVYNWIREHSSNAKVFLWGHSLGTGVVSHFAVEVVGKGEEIKGIVLEAPFTKLSEVVRTKPIMQALSVLPWFEFCFIEPLKKFDLSFESDIHLKKIATPILILHAKDDQDVIYPIGVKLYETIADSRQDQSTVKMVSYESELGYGHFNIPTDPNLGNIISIFVEQYVGSVTTNGQDSVKRRTLLGG